MGLDSDQHCTSSLTCLYYRLESNPFVDSLHSPDTKHNLLDGCKFAMQLTPIGAKPLGTHHDCLAVSRFLLLARKMLPFTGAFTLGSRRSAFCRSISALVLIVTV